MCQFLGSLGAITLIIAHTFLINPLRALFVVLSRFPSYFLLEYHRGLLVSSNGTDSESSSTDSSDTELTSIRRRTRLAASNPEDEELFRFLNFHRQHQIRLLGLPNNSSSSSSNSTVSLQTTLDTQAQGSSAGLDTELPPINPNIRLPVVLNYRRRELQTDLDDRDQDDTVDYQVDDPLTYFYRNMAARHSARNNSNMSGSNSKVVYTDDEWEKVVSDMHVGFHDLNSLIMNYLMIEGYQDAARKFAQEAKLNLASSGLGGITLPYNNGAPDQEEVFTSVHDRMIIKNLIHTGQIQKAIEKINDVDPELLDIHGDLHFALLRLQLIELIRACNYPSTLPKSGPSIAHAAPGDIGPALEFAATHLARRAPANPKFLADLEKTMALLCFPPDDKTLVPELKELMDIKLRQSVAREVNNIILARQGIVGQPKMVNLIKLWAWGEQELAKEKVVFPRLDRSRLG